MLLRYGTPFRLAFEHILEKQSLDTSPGAVKKRVIGISRNAIVA